MSEVPDLASATGRELVLGVRPEHLKLVECSDLTGIVQVVEMLGSESLIHVDIAGLDFYAHSVDETARTDVARLIIKVHDSRDLPRIGDPAAVAFHPEHLRVFDASSGDALSAASRS